MLGQGRRESPDPGLAVAVQGAEKLRRLRRTEAGAGSTTAVREGHSTTEGVLHVPKALTLAESNCVSRIQLARRQVFVLEAGQGRFGRGTAPDGDL